MGGWAGRIAQACSLTIREAQACSMTVRAAQACSLMVWTRSGDAACQPPGGVAEGMSLVHVARVLT
jgi:hypothetical protein